jgi:hypothetical protein
MVQIELALIGDALIGDALNGDASILITGRIWFKLESALKLVIVAIA